MRNVGLTGKHKLADRWTTTAYHVVRRIADDMPVYVVRPEDGGPDRTLHRKIAAEDPAETALTLVSPSETSSESESLSSVESATTERRGRWPVRRRQPPNRFGYGRVGRSKTKMMEEQMAIRKQFLTMVQSCFLQI